jgi:hypothetical protein
MAAAMNVTPSRPTPARPAFETPEKYAAIRASVHWRGVKSGTAGAAYQVGRADAEQAIARASMCAASDVRSGSVRGGPSS